MSEKQKNWIKNVETLVVVPSIVQTTWFNCWAFDTGNGKSDIFTWTALCTICATESFYEFINIKNNI